MTEIKLTDLMEAQKKLDRLLEAVKPFAKEFREHDDDLESYCDRLTWDHWGDLYYAYFSSVNGELDL